MSHAPIPRTPDAAGPADAPLSRRAALWLTSRLAMVAGLVGGYGMFAWVSGRFMLPPHTGQLHQLFDTCGRLWMFYARFKHVNVSGNGTSCSGTCGVM